MGSIKFKEEVIFLPSSMRPGGESKFVIQFIKAHRERYKFVLYSPDSFADSEVIDKDTDTVTMTNVSGFFSVLFAGFYYTILRQPKLLIGGGRKGGLLAHLIGFFARKPVLYIPHGNHYLDSFKLLDRLYRYIDMFFLPRETVYLMSYAEKVRYARNGIKVNKNMIIRNYIGEIKNDPCNILKIDRSKINLVWIGRCDPHKNLYQAINYVDRWCVQNEPQINLDVYVTPPKNDEENAYLEKCLSIGSQNWQIRTDVLDYSKLKESHDALFFTSKGEGSSYVIIEAMSYQIPIVASNVHGVREAIGSKRGALIKSYSEFSHAMLSLSSKASKFAYHQAHFIGRYHSPANTQSKQLEAIRLASIKR